MKGKRIFLMISAILLILSIVLASCGGGAKSLAKQSYDLQKRIEAAGIESLTDVSLMMESANLMEKVEKLSPEDQKIYYEELQRLQDQD